MTERAFRNLFNSPKVLFKTITLFETEKKNKLYYSSSSPFCKKEHNSPVLKTVREQLMNKRIYLNLAPPRKINQKKFAPDPLKLNKELIQRLRIITKKQKFYSPLSVRNNSIPKRHKGRTPILSNTSTLNSSGSNKQICKKENKNFSIMSLNETNKNNKHSKHKMQSLPTISNIKHMYNSHKKNNKKTNKTYSFKVTNELNEIKNSPIIKEIKIANETNTNVMDDNIIKDFIGKTKLKEGQEYEMAQNTYFIQQNVFELQNFYIFGYFQGIGKEGYNISCIAKQNFLYYYTSEITFFHNSPKNTIKNEDYIYSKLIENDYELIRKSFEKISIDILISIYDYKSSGCSVLLLFSVGKKVICVNLGSIKAFGVLYSKETIIEEFKGIILTDEVYNENEKVLGCGEFKQFRRLRPLIKEIDMERDILKSIVISNPALFKILGQTSLVKMLNRGRDNKEKISQTCDKITELYKEYCKRKSVPVEEIDFIIIYY